MNDIIFLLGIEDDNINIIDFHKDEDSFTKTITIEKKPYDHFCPKCGSKMYSRGIKERIVRHPILQDGYRLIIHIMQRRWRCNNQNCKYDSSDTFKFVNKCKQTTNALDLLVVNAFRDINRTAADIGRQYNISDHMAIDIFTRYVNMKQLKLSDIISVDEIYLDMDKSCKYALVLQDFYTGEPIDVVKSRQTRVTLPYFQSIPYEERKNVKYLLSDMYNPYINYTNTYFPNALPVVDSFHVIRWLLNKIETFIRNLQNEYKRRDFIKAEAEAKTKGKKEFKPKVSDEVYLLQNHRWVILRNQDNIHYYNTYKKNRYFGYAMNTYMIEEKFLSIHKDFFQIRELKEQYITFNKRNVGNPERAAVELDEIIELYEDQSIEIFQSFAETLKSYKIPIINSFNLVERTVAGKIKVSRLSNGPIESMNRNFDTLIRNSRGYLNFDHIRNRILFCLRNTAEIENK